MPLQSRLSMALPPTLIFDYPTISAISSFVAAQAGPAPTHSDGPAPGRASGAIAEGKGCRPEQALLLLHPASPAGPKPTQPGV